MKKESEKLIEQKLREAVKERGGNAIKLLSQYHAGLPDRLVLMPQGKIYFVELKTTGEKPRLLQERAHEKLREMGFKVYVIDSTATLQNFMTEL